MKTVPIWAGGRYAIPHASFPFLRSSSLHRHLPESSLILFPPVSSLLPPPSSLPVPPSSLPLFETETRRHLRTPAWVPRNLCLCCPSLGSLSSRGGPELFAVLAGRAPFPEARRRHRESRRSEESRPELSTPHFCLAASPAGSIREGRGDRHGSKAPDALLDDQIRGPTTTTTTTSRGHAWLPRGHARCAQGGMARGGDF